MFHVLRPIVSCPDLDLSRSVLAKNGARELMYWSSCYCLFIVLVNAFFLFNISVELYSSKNRIFLIGEGKHEIKKKVLAACFIIFVKCRVNESLNFTIRACIISWEKARIPTKSIPNCIKLLNNWSAKIKKFFRKWTIPGSLKYYDWLEAQQFLIFYCTKNF